MTCGGLHFQAMGRDSITSFLYITVTKGAPTVYVSTLGDGDVTVSDSRSPGLAGAIELRLTSHG